MSWTLEAREPGATRRVAVEHDCLDAASAPDFRATVLDLLRDPSPLVLDLSRVQFADSSGLGALCSVARAAAPGQLALDGIGPRLARDLGRAPAASLPPRAPKACLRALAAG